MSGSSTNSRSQSGRLPPQPRRPYAAYEAYKDDLRQTARTYIVQARAEGRPILVVAGRPYHMDPEINHGINDLITSFGFTLITEDSVAWLEA